MATETPKIKHRVKVEISDGKYKYARLEKR